MPFPRRSAPTPLALALALALAVVHLPAQAADAGADHDHEPVKLDEVRVVASPLGGTAEDLTRPVSVLSGDRLDAAKASSLGETVSKLPGVQSTYFGPGVGRPVVRGFGGARVQVLSDGLGAGDVSTVSVDHAVTIEPFLANQIEVLKGPSTLLYGAGAIGGAVNVVDGRIPEAATAEPLEGRAELRAGSVNDERTGMVRVDGTDASGSLVFHADALHRETGDYRIPGYAESAAHLAAEGESPDPSTRGLLPNSAVRTDSGALGVSWIGARGFVGAGVSMFNTRYGVPGHAHAGGDHGHGDDADAGAGHGVHILMDQRRGELRGGLDDLGAFRSLRVKLARTTYTHTEFEGQTVGTVFDNDGTEARVELVHRPLLGWDGAIGAQWSRREFLAIGEEAFVPGSAANDLGAFWLGRRTVGPLRLELGARHDRNEVDVDDARATGPDRSFDSTSLSAALRWNIDADTHVSLGLDRAQRSPTAEELYSGGYHVATAAVEIGDAGLDVETANRIELGVHWHRGPLTLALSAWHVRYDDFIHLVDTGVDDGGPVHLWTQADARFNGGEAQLDWQLADNDSGTWTMRLFGDVVRARLAGEGSRTVAFDVPHDGHGHHHEAEIAAGGNLPRIAPQRVGAELGWRREAWRASLGAVRYARQDRVAPHETPTPGYTLVDAHLAWHHDTRAGNALELFADGSNLLDREARVHTSFLKDLAPLPGRGVSVGLRLFF